MDFRITGLSPAAFRPLRHLSDDELAARGVVRCVADSKPGYPCRVTLEDAEPGECVLLLNYMHQPAATPYRASHAIYVREVAAVAYDAVGLVPAALRARVLSVRAFDRNDMMHDADIVAGDEAAPLFERYLADAAVGYVQVHYAKRGCYAARVERAAPA